MANLTDDDVIVVPPSTAPVKLMMVTEANNNKVYNMIPNGSTVTIQWGRVGAVLQEVTKPISKWSSLYKEKRKKGYKDITDLVKESVKKSTHKKIADVKVNALMDQLLSYARTSVKENYTISSDAVTQAQLSEAQGYVDELTGLVVLGADNQKLNKMLLGLYTVIPRKMNKVANYLIPEVVDTNDKLQHARNLIDNEQKTLDVMSGQVKMRGVAPVGDDAPDQTILDALGIQVVPGDLQDEQIAKSLMGPDAREFKSVYKVIHAASRNIFNDNLALVTNRKCELFWHGSRNENWISILQTGLKIRPSNAILTGAMFGHGIYFADKYRKSAGYTSLNGSYWVKGGSNTAFLALMDVHVGNQYHIRKHTHDCYSLNKVNLKKKGNYDSLFVEGGIDLRNNEYIVYNDSQSTIKYLVQVGK